MTTRLITADELTQAPTGFDWEDVAESIGATSVTEAVEQLRVIDRASAWASKYCFGRPSRLDATVDTETARVAPAMTKAFVDNQGWLWFNTDFFPILSVTSFQWAPAMPGQQGVSYIPLIAANIQMYGEGFRNRRLADYSQDWTFLKSGGMVQSQYINGWPNAVLTAPLSSGVGQTATVDTTLGMTPTPGPMGIGAQLSIYDNVISEDVVVSSVTDSTHVVLANVISPHQKGVGISALPSDARWGVILACLHFGRVRGTDAVTFIGESEASRSSGPKEESDALSEAMEALWEFRRLF